MGLFWDLMQQSQISKQRNQSDNLENRVLFLEKELYDTKRLLHELIKLLENKFGEDINGNGKIG